MSSKLALTFRMFQNDQLIREDTLAQGVIKIGKVPSAHLRIDDESVSRMHAIVEVTGGDVCLIDLGSTRGTFVNGRKINKATLQSGDVIAVGDTRLELAIAGPAARPLAVELAGAALAPRPTAELAIASAAPEPRAVPAAVDAASRSPAVDAGAPAPAFEPTAALAKLPPPIPVIALGAAAREVHAIAEPDGSGGARAVEVAAMLGDSVIGVKHCIDPRSGRVSPATWGVIAAGVACVVVSAIAFAASVSTAAANEHRLDAWQRANRPAHAFRPHELGVTVDWLAFGGLALGLAGLTLGLARARRERVHPYYRIGTAPGVELAVDGAPSAAFPLIAPSGDDFVFNYGGGIDGELIVDGKATPLAELAAAGRSRPSAAIAGAVEVAIPPAARIRARAGQTTFVVSSVARPRRHATPLLAGLDGRTLAYIAGSLAVHLVAWGLLRLIPPDAAEHNLELEASEDASTRWARVAQIEPPPDEQRNGGGGEGDGGGVEAAPMALPSGVAGNPEAERAERRMQVARTQDQPQLSREEAIQRARDAGFLGSDRLRSGITAFAATGHVSSGPDLIDVRGGIYGSGGESWGNFGGGVHGLDMGGGCEQGPCGTIGTRVRYDTIGGGVHAGDNYRPFRGNGPGGTGRNPILPRIGEPTTSGASYDKSIVRRYIRRHINEIGYCYDKQLLARPGIEGEVTVAFLISPVGNVQSASATGFDADVARCLAAVIQNIGFPSPRDGGVQVNYPFHFRAAGR